MTSGLNHTIPYAALAILLSAVTWSVSAADEMSPIGRWKTISDKTGHETGIVEISKSGDVLVGKVVKIIAEPGDPADPVCKKCDGPEKDQRVLGMTILKGFHRDGDAWDGGTILDPRTGSIYSSEIHLDDGGHKLQVRGYIGISLLGRTQTWIRDE
jgi:uncharacterized protein (DUF2147 family)